MQSFVFLKPLTWKTTETETPLQFYSLYQMERTEKDLYS